jgi:multidrug resistance protein MdtO
VACALVITVSMALEVPFLALAVIAVFFATQENLPLTRLLTVLGLLGLTLSIGCSILLLRWAVNDPLWRILGSCALAFAGIYLMQVSQPLKLAGFLTALAVVYTQSLPDLLPDGERLVRLLLWVLVAGFYPACVALGVTWLFPVSRPGRQLRLALDHELDKVLGRLAAGRGGPCAAPGLEAVERSVTVRHRLFESTALEGAKDRAERGRHLARLATVERLQLAAARLEPGTPEPGPLADLLLRACAQLKQALDQDRAFRLEAGTARELDAAEPADPALREMVDALRDLAAAEAAPPVPGAPAPRPRLIRADAFRDTTCAKVALRTVIASMACYVFYSAVDWPGIHTAMLTCVILSLPPLGVASLGGISHKGYARVLGAALGSAVALFQTVFILPHLDGITGLLAMVLPVVALAGWLASGSARSHYVGRQLIFTYALAMLGGFALSPDIPEIRDRLVGVLVGVGVYLFLSAVLWPHREGAAIRAHLGRIARSLAALVRVEGDAVPMAPGLRSLDRARTECWTVLRQSRDLELRVALEPGPGFPADSAGLDLHAGFAQAREALAAAHWLHVLLGRLEPSAVPEFLRAVVACRAEAALRLERLALGLEGTGGVPVDPATERGLAAVDAFRGGERRIEEVIAAVHALHDRIALLGATLLWSPSPAEES